LPKPDFGARPPLYCRRICLVKVQSLVLLDGREDAV
jgi:hypothetical protein